MSAISVPFVAYFSCKRKEARIPAQNSKEEKKVEKTSTILNSARKLNILLSVLFTLARRCLFIAPTPPGPLRIFKIEFSNLRQ